MITIALLPFYTSQCMLLHSHQHAEERANGGGERAGRFIVTAEVPMYWFIIYSSVFCIFGRTKH